MATLRFCLITWYWFLSNNGGLFSSVTVTVTDVVVMVKSSSTPRNMAKVDTMSGEVKVLSSPDVPLTEKRPCDNEKKRLNLVERIFHLKK